MPHSRYNTITRDQFEEAGFTILVESAEAGVHAAVSDDQFRRVYFQGHPEYDANSLLKEYKREVLRHFNGERDLPPFPSTTSPTQAAAVITQYLDTALRAHDAGRTAAGISGSGGRAISRQHLDRHRPGNLRPLARPGLPADELRPPPSVP